MLDLTTRGLFGLLFITLFFIGACEDPSTTKPPDDPNADKNRAELKSGTVKPNETKGPYPEEPPSDMFPNDYKVPDVPVGPKIGDMKPTSKEFNIRPFKTGQERDADQAAALNFKDYKDLVSARALSSQCCPEVSVAENGQTVMLTGNGWMSLSEDGGATFTTVNPTTIFPQADGGFCCDQVVQYVPQIDMFVWLLQYRRTPGTNNNRIRMAAQTTAQVRSSNGTSWTYWDFTNNFFNAGRWLDYNDMSVGNSTLWWCTNTVGGGRNVLRIQQSQIAAKSTINFSFAPETPNSYFSHISQNGTNTVYWGGHINNSELRVYSMKDGDGFYSWRSVNVNSWPQNGNKSLAPDGTDWLQFDVNRYYVFGNAVQGGSLWFAWLASAGGGFPQPHVQMVKMNTSTWAKQEQVQIWNSKFAFGYPYLSTNAENELGMSVGFGGGNFYPSHAVGVWGDFVVYYPTLSTRATTRWGDYNTVRRAGGDATKGLQWVAGGYTMDTDGSGNNVMEPHYIRFGR